MLCAAIVFEVAELLGIIAAHMHADLYVQFVTLMLMQWIKGLTSGL